MTSAPLPPFAQLYREHFDAVWAVLRRLGVPTASLEDGVHDVFMVVHRRRDGFEGRSTVRTWILGIARRIAFRHRRTRARAQQRHLALASVALPTPDPDDDIARREAWHALQAFLDELDEGKRAAFVLGELERLSRQELGAALGVSPNTAYSRLRAARAQFHVRFSDGRSRPVLAAARHVEPPPAESRQRVSLMLAGGLRDTAVPVASMWSAKAMLTTVGLATAVLGLTALAVPRPHEGTNKASSTERAPIETHTSSAPGPMTEPGSRAATTSAVTATVASTPTTETTTVAPTTVAPATRERSELRGSPVPASAPARALSSDLAAETSLLLTARTALARGRPRAALEALDEHRRRFLAGVLAEEREASRIRAHCALGQHEVALREARALVAAHPRSAYLGPLEEFCPPAVINSARAGDPLH